DTAVFGKEAYDISVIVGAAGSVRCGTVTGDHQLLDTPRIVDLEVPGRVLRRVLDAGERVVVGIGPAEHDLNRTGFPAPGAGDLLAIVSETHEVVRCAATPLVGVDYGHDVAVRQWGNRERLLYEPLSEVDLGKAIFAEACIRSAIGVQAA